MRQKNNNKTNNIKAKTNKKVTVKKSTAKVEKKTEAKKLSALDKMHIRMQLMQDSGLTQKKAEAYLEKFNWDKEKTYKYPTIKKKIKEHLAEIQKQKAEALFSLDDENKNNYKSNKKASSTVVKKRAKKSKIDAKLDEIERQYDKNDGVTYIKNASMEKIYKWVKKNVKLQKLPSVVKLEEFNKKHKTKYSSWKELCEKQTMTEKELNEYDTYVDWYEYLKHHKPDEFTDKFRKKHDDHFTQVYLGIIKYNGKVWVENK